MAQIKLYKGPKTGSNSAYYNSCTYDFENATADLDYIIDNQATGTMPTTGEELKQIRLHITLAGINFLSGYEESSTSKENLVLPPVYDVGDGTQSNPFDISEAKSIPIGEKPTDWELRYMDKYFTKTTSQYNGVYYANYASAGVARSGVYYPNWDEDTHYYEVPNFAQIFYTDSAGFFGVSRSLNPTGATNIQETVRVLYNRRPYGSGNFYPGEFWWKANGAFGTQLFPQSLATSQNVMINMSSSQANAMNTYQSRLLVQMIRFDYEEETYTGIVVITLSADGLPQEAQITALSAPFWKQEITPANGGPNSRVQGGNGTFNGDSDNRGDENGNTAASIVSNWQSASAVIGLAFNAYLLDTSSGTDRSAFAQMVTQLWNPDTFDGFENKMMNPIDSILCCQQVPKSLANIPLPTQQARIRAASVNLSTDSVSKFDQLITLSKIGRVNIEEYTGSFADYTDCSIYIHLPYIGTKQLDTAAVMDGWLRVDYMVDLFSGDCTAVITTEDKFGNRNLRYEFKGNCAKNIPLKQKIPISTLVAEAGIKAALTMGATALGGAIAGSITAGALNAAGARNTRINATNQYRTAVGSSIASSVATASGGIADSALNAAMSGQQTVSSNAHGGGVSSPVDSQCYLLITRPQWSNPEFYANQKAYPSDISGTINNVGFSGFLQTQTIKLNGITATDEERYEIATRMNAGVYV